MSDFGSRDPQKGKKPNNDWPRFPLGGPKLPDMKPLGGWKFSILYILILIIGLSLFNYVFLNKVNPTIDFSEFKTKITNGEIKRVEMTDAYYTGFTTLKPNSGIRQSPSLKGSYGSQPDAVYRTVPIYDPDIIKLMDEKGVNYYAVSREGSVILNIIFSWILPIAFFFYLALLHEAAGQYGRECAFGRPEQGGDSRRGGYCNPL